MSSKQEEPSLQLEFVYPLWEELFIDFISYGYQGSKCRDNLFYLESGEIVYHIAGAGIVHNPQNHTQRFFTGHTDDIIIFFV